MTYNYESSLWWKKLKNILWYFQHSHDRLNVVEMTSGWPKRSFHHKFICTYALVISISPFKIKIWNKYFILSLFWIFCLEMGFFWAFFCATFELFQYFISYFRASFGRWFVKDELFLFVLKICCLNKSKSLWLKTCQNLCWGNVNI